MTEQPPPNIDTSGGTYIEGNVSPGGDVVFGDKYVLPPPTGIAALHQLPPPPGDFTGRTTELAQLRAAIEQGGAIIVGLRGLAGMGKTALALTLAAEMKDRYPDAQFFVDLRGSHENPMATAEALNHVIRGYHPTAQLPTDLTQLQAIYRDTLTGQRALILLDDARNVTQIAPLIPPQGCLLLLTTSHKLTLPGLKLLDLHTLAPADAIGLLHSIAPRIGSHAARIAELCGDLPLALRLAANLLNQYDDLAVETYIAQLSDESQRIAALDRAQQLTDTPGVQASIELSLNVLDQALRHHWALLAVFPTDFGAAAAQAVWEVDEDRAQTNLSELCRHSLLDWNADTHRYRLPNLARMVASARLTAKQRETAALRHATYYCQLLTVANQLYLQGSEYIPTGLALYDREQTNIHAGQTWAAARAKDNDTAAALAEAYPDAGGYVLALRIHPHQQITWLQTALTAARRLGRKPSEQNHLGNLGLAWADLGQFPRAIEYYQQALSISRQIGDRHGQANALGNLGVAHYRLGQIPRAIEHYQQALDIIRQIGDRRGEANALMNTGNAHYSLGEAQQAIEYHQQALPIFRQLGDRRGEANALANLGTACQSLGQLPRAIEYYQHALQIIQTIGDKRAQSGILGNLGVIYKKLGQLPRAIQHYQQQIDIMRQTGDRHGEALGCWNLGLLHEQQGDLPRAIQLMQTLVDLEHQTGHPDAQTDAAYLDKIRARLVGSNDP